MELEIADETVPVQSQTLSGVYVDTELLTGQLEQVSAELAALEPGNGGDAGCKKHFWKLLLLHPK